MDGRLADSDLTTVMEIARVVLKKADPDNWRYDFRFMFSDILNDLDISDEEAARLLALLEERMNGKPDADVPT